MSWDIFGTEREALRKRISELQSAKFNAEYDSKKLMQRIEQLQAEIKELKQFKNFVANYKSQHELDLREIEILKYKLNSQNNLNNSKQTNDNLNDSEIARLKNNNSSLLTEVERARTRINEKNDVIQSKNHEIKELNQNIVALQNSVDEKERQLDSVNQKLLKKEKFIKEQKEFYEELLQDRESIEKIKLQINKIASLPFAQIPNDFKESILSGRLANAFESTSLQIHGPLQISATIRSENNFYKTTLTTCTCPDYVNRHVPCKHMLFLSYTSGLMLLNNEAFTDFAKNYISKLNSKIATEKEEIAIAKYQNKLLQQKNREHVKLVDRLVTEVSQSYPWIASMYKRFQIEQDNHDAYLLSSRSSSAKDIVKKLKKSNKNLRYEKSLLENQILVYESLFPWLEEFKKVDVNKAVEYVKQTHSDEEYDKVSDYLSPAEYKALSSTKKNQLALDRYKKRRKSDWEIGVDYERYIGYCYEMQGYKVKYSGAIDRLKDMGRDLICIRGDQMLVIQCKRWSSRKTIHEKHIFQLFGSTIQMKYLNPEKEYTPVFITTTQLSEVAQYCADQLGIQTVEKKKFIDYPCIKCNISKDGSKIYHLPFDQQYDRINIELSRGECYAHTVEEAEEKGFRRAFKHQVQ